MAGNSGKAYLKLKLRVGQNWLPMRKHLSSSSSTSWQEKALILQWPLPDPRLEDGSIEAVARKAKWPSCKVALRAVSRIFNQSLPTSPVRG
jgi:hypothetical protein